MTDWMTTAFEESRPRLHSVAYRMLGSSADADDVVQEAWIRLRRAGPEGIDNFSAWLTTVVARICLDVLRSRKSHPEEPAQTVLEREREPVTRTGAPEDEVALSESLGPALMLVLDRLTPAERLAFVLHDMFGVAFEEIAVVLGRSPVAARQLASRARRRVRTGPVRSGARAPGGTDGVTLRRQRRVVAAFLAASRSGNFAALLEVLDPEVVLRADGAAVETAARRAAQGAPPLEEEMRGASAVARVFLGGAAAAQLAVVDGAPGAVWAPGGRPRAVFVMDASTGWITAIEVVVDRRRIATMDIELVEAMPGPGPAGSP